MKTALVTTSYLIPDDRFNKIIKYIDYYKNATSWDIIVLDNASPKEQYDKFCLETNNKCKIIRYDEHHGRPSHMDYKYLWRAVHSLQGFLKEYDKIVYTDNDFFILDHKMIDYINDLKDGWTTFWCEKYKFPETGCHVVVKNCPEYDNFVNCNLQEFYDRYNNKNVMERLLPITKVETQFIGERYGEISSPQQDFMQYYAQCPSEIKLIFKGK